MGNKSSQPFKPIDDLTKRFTAEELQKLENDYPHTKRGTPQSSHPNSLSREQFLLRFGEDHGPATRRVIARLFKVLEATQGSAAAGGGLEYEAIVRAAYFFTKATNAERAKVLFSMYESQPSGGHLTKADMATFCAETTFALAERVPVERGPPYSSGTEQSSSSYRPLVQMDPNVAPFKDLTNVMVDVAFARHDADRDGKLSFLEFQHFAQHPDSGVDALLDCITAGTQEKF